MHQILDPVCPVGASLQRTCTHINYTCVRVNATTEVLATDVATTKVLATDVATTKVLIAYEALASYHPAPEKTLLSK